MFLRLFFVLLMALNIAVGAWLLLGQPYAHGGIPSDPGVTELRLLSELPQAAAPTPATVPSSSPAPAPRPGKVTCLTLGPFATPQSLRGARDALQPLVIRMRSRQESASQVTGWWVYLPSSKNRAEALAVAQRLGDKNIDDYFVVNAGDQPNAISLGLFKDPVNARNRREQLIRAGFPALMQERSEEVPQFWLDLVASGGRELDWRSRIGTGTVGSHSAACF